MFTFIGISQRQKRYLSSAFIRLITYNINCKTKQATVIQKKLSSVLCENTLHVKRIIVVALYTGKCERIITIKGNFCCLGQIVEGGAHEIVQTKKNDLK